MAAARKNIPSASRTKAVPVRVIKSSQPRRPAVSPPPAPEQKVPFVKKVAKVDRRERMMWIGVVLVASLVLFLWIGFARSIYTSPNGERETLFSKIGNDLAAWVKKLREPGKGSANSSDKELNELRERVFPKLKNENPATLETVNANQNVNTDAALNLNIPITNTSFNVNDAP